MLGSVVAVTGNLCTTGNLSTANIPGTTSGVCALHAYICRSFPKPHVETFWCNAALTFLDHMHSWHGNNILFSFTKAFRVFQPLAFLSEVTQLKKQSVFRASNSLILQQSHIITYSFTEGGATLQLS